MCAHFCDSARYNLAGRERNDKREIKMPGINSAEARDLCRNLLLETLRHLDVGPRLREALRLRNGVLEIAGESYPEGRFQSIRVVSFGKAAREMAEVAAESLAGTGLRGVVVAPNTAPPPGGDSPAFEFFQGGHPYPNAQSCRAAEATLAFLENCSRDNAVLFLISGGGSALLEKSLCPSVSAEDLHRFHEVLVTCGASIYEINVLRKHFSAVKGGRLAERAAPATQVTLYVSDVPDHLPSTVASGPTMPDESTVEDCRRIAASYDLLPKFPGSIRAVFNSGDIAETPKPGNPIFARSSYYCLLSNREGVGKLAELAQAKGLRAETDLSCDDWEYRQAADHLLARLGALRKQHPGHPVVVVSGGELSCPVSGEGLGGRNQAFVLDCVAKIAGQPIVVLSAGTDGIDGNSPACGAIADGDSAGRAARLELAPESFLREGNSYRFFEKLGDTVVTGPTGTNVRDLRILMTYS